MEPQTDNPGSEIDFDERVEVVRVLISQGKRNGEIKRRCSKDWGIDPRTVERYITKAREILREDLGLSRQDLQFDLVAKLEEIAGHEKTPALTKIRALENVARILGLYQPQGITIAAEPHKMERQEDPVNRLLEDPDFVEFQIRKAALEDREAADASIDRDLPESSDTGPVWKDDYEGPEESGAVA